MKIGKIYFAILAFGIISLLGGCGSDSEDILTKYDTAKLLNFSETNDYDIITGSKATTALRSLSSNSNIQSSSFAWLKIAKDVQKTLNAKKYTTRTYTDDGTNVIYENREYGDIAGYVDIRLVINKNDGSFSGSMEYNDYQNSEDGLCENSYLTMNGKLNVEGDYDLYNDTMRDMTMDVVNEIDINNIVFKDNFSVMIEYQNEDENDAILTLNGDIIQYDKNYGFKDYKLRSYEGAEYKYNYSYPISGNLYIFSDNLDGYFYVDSFYRHDLTPTKTDMCEEHFYAGKERYLGDNSTLVYTIDSMDHYHIDIDYENDGTIDKTIDGEL